MNDSLPQLEAQKSDLLRQLAAVGDLRRGSITATSGKCGKPNCHCAKRGDPGHGPNFCLTRRVTGKTITETFDSPAALRMAQQEVAEFHRFQKLSGEVVEVSEKICALRPVEDTFTPEKKKTAAAIHAEVAREVTTLLGRVFAERKQAGDLDLEAVEMAFRAALHIDIMLEQSGIVKLYKVYKSTNSANFCLAVSGSLVSILYRVL